LITPQDPTAIPRLELHGFNNLTKSLSFNIYDICYAKTAAHKERYIKYIDAAYNAQRLTKILADVSGIIGASILNVARQDYEPQGASVTMLIAEESVEGGKSQPPARPGPVPDSLVGHLDKSHICVHTYPEMSPGGGLSTFRADVDVSTCGVVSPLRALNYLIHSFESDVVIIDYRVRGFTRDVRGRKHFIDHKINSIQNYIARDTKRRYQMMDVNVYQEYVFHTKMVLKELDLDDHLFDTAKDEIPEAEERLIAQRIRREMMEIFYSRNMSKGMRL